MQTFEENKHVKKRLLIEDLGDSLLLLVVKKLNGLRNTMNMSCLI